MFREDDGHLTRRTVRALSGMHTFAFRATRGALGRRLAGNDMLLLTTVGRRSGTRHRVPLLYLRDGDTVVVVASFGGHDHHPDWYRNLVSSPDTEIQIGGRRIPVTARVADPRRRAELWPRIVAALERYATYQARTEREIPVVLLKPRPQGV